MLQVQDIYDAFSENKRDVDDIPSTAFIQWARFTVDFIYEKLKGVAPQKFVKSQSYSVLIPPQTEDLPTDFMDMNQTVCGLFKYDSRKREVVTFDEDGDSGITFSDSGGTGVYNSVTRVKGGSSRGYTGDGAATMLLSFDTNENLNDFDDGGSVSPSNDFISVWVYIGNTVPTSATIEFSTLNTGADVGVNQLSYVKTGLVAGWNRIKVAKSAFTLTGSASWASLGYLRLLHTGGDSTTNVYWDKLDILESETNGKGQTSEKIGITNYGSKKEGYYLDGDSIVFTNGSDLMDQDFVMRYIPNPPVVTALADYMTIDLTASTVEIVKDRHLDYLVKAIDVLYEQWNVDPSAESMADFRFVRALDRILEGYSPTPQVSVMRNPSGGF